MQSQGQSQGQSGGKTARLDFLDQIRGLAILAVFLYHSLTTSFGYGYLKWNGWFHDFSERPAYLALCPLTYGTMGVAIFFVVSGICIHIAHQRSSRKDWPTFFSRRFFRIYPPYLLALLGFSFTSFVYPAHAFGAHLSHVAEAGTVSNGWQVITHLFLLQNYNAHTLYAINGAFWTLSVECQLYLIYPLLLFLVRKLTWGRTLILLAVLECTERAITTYCVNHGIVVPNWLAFSPFYFWFSWALGAAAADAFLNGRPFGLAKKSAICFTSLLVVAFFFKPLEEFTFTIEALATVSIVGLLLNRQTTAPGTGRGPIARAFDFIGLTSYSLYLLHQPLLYLVPHLATKLNHGQPAHPLLNFALCLVALGPILLLAWGYYRFVELPSIAAGKWFIANKLKPSRG